MEGVSDSFRVLNEKLNEILKLAEELDHEEQKLAAEAFQRAGQHIRSLWRRSSHIQDVLSQIKEEEERFTENASSSAWTENGTLAEAQTESQIKKIAVDQEERDGEAVNKVRKSNRVNKSLNEKSAKVLVKSEPTETHQDVQDNLQETIKVQSISEMLYNDPVLAPSMSRFKKTVKSERTGKMETVYQCDECSRQCRTAGAFNKHWSTHNKNLECPICCQRLSSKNALNAHRRTHTGERPYECTKCSARFTTKGNLRRHIAGHEVKKPWQCSLCYNCYTEKKSLKVHMRKHTGEKPYVCTVCHKRFSQSGILQTHMLIHSDKYAHLCDICGRSFRQRSQLVTHHLRHRGVRPFPCQNCGRSFTTKGDMERHLRTHTGERPFSCDVCGSSFARLQTLQEHKNRHYDFKPYMCMICGKTFHEMAACSRHIKGLHAREKGDAPASASVLRLANSEEQQDEGKKQSMLVTHPDISNCETKDDAPSPTAEEPSDGNEEIEEEEDEEEEEEVEEEVEGEDEEDIDAVGEERREEVQHIFVMHTAEPEETKLITIAESPTVEGLGVTDWVEQDGATNHDDSGDIIDGKGSAGNAVQVVASDLEHHTVTISEDVSITSLPLSQLPPLHLQLESDDYMVVLREPSDGEQPPPTLH